MNVAVIGSGGREHALALKIKESPLLENLYVIPGNPGTLSLGENVNLNISEQQKIISFCKKKKIDLVVIGPEQPLVEGLSDLLRDNEIKVFGPGKAASEIEEHKSFAKKIMKIAGVPTAQYIEFTAGMYEHAKDFIKNKSYPCVIKTDGLAAGKGVYVCNDSQEAASALENIFINKLFGESGNNVLIEEFLQGEEASVFAITDGTDFICLPASQDHKRIGDNDTGKNTGGMGSYAPAPVVTPDIMEKVKNKIIAPTLATMKDEGKPFSGCLYVGLMITDDGPKVVEFNCRFGDPETQVVLPVLSGDFLQLIYSAASGKIDKNSVKYSGGSSVCVVCASNGYPDNYEKGFEITGLNEIPGDVIVYHAGTKKDDDKILTNGGRVLGVTSVLNEFDLKAAKEKAYTALEKISFKNIYYRKDIADRAIN